MAKHKGQVLARGKRASDTAGAKKSYKIDTSLLRSLGQGSKVMFHLRIWGLDTNCRVTFRALHGCLGEYTPDEEGFPVLISDGSSSATSKVFTGTANIKGHLLWTDETLLADVLVIVEVDDTAATNIVGADLELWATVIEE
jgi:hypothetical protein